VAEHSHLWFQTTNPGIFKTFCGSDLADFNDRKAEIRTIHSIGPLTTECKACLSSAALEQKAAMDLARERLDDLLRRLREAKKRKVNRA